MRLCPNGTDNQHTQTDSGRQTLVLTSSNNKKKGHTFLASNVQAHATMKTTAKPPWVWCYMGWAGLPTSHTLVERAEYRLKK